MERRKGNSGKEVQLETEVANQQQQARNEESNRRPERRTRIRPFARAAAETAPGAPLWQYQKTSHAMHLDRVKQTRQTMADAESRHITSRHTDVFTQTTKPGSVSPEVRSASSARADWTASAAAAASASA